MDYWDKRKNKVITKAVIVLVAWITYVGYVSTEYEDNYNDSYFEDGKTEIRKG